MKRILMIVMVLLILVLANATQLSFAARERDIPIIYGIDEISEGVAGYSDADWQTPVLFE